MSATAKEADEGPVLLPFPRPPRELRFRWRRPGAIRHEASFAATGPDDFALHAMLALSLMHSECPMHLALDVAVSGGAGWRHLIALLPADVDEVAELLYLASEDWWRKATQ